VSEYLTFQLSEEPRPGRKTSVYEVIAVRSGDVLGEIRWFGRWRQYTFWPTPGTTFNPSCLRAIASFAASQTEGHRAPARATPAQTVPPHADEQQWAR
jgi:hypothetical protein